MSRLSVAALCTALACGCLCCWGTAGASGVGSERVLLGYLEEYAGPDGASRTHRGADISREPGSRIAAHADGVVRFAGRIPAGQGASTYAVTVETAEGTLVTCMPLEQLLVRQGDSVMSSDPVGTLAEAGDPSLGSPHLHLSCRIGETYVDPLSVVTLPPVLSAGQEAADTVPSLEGCEAPASVGGELVGSPAAPELMTQAPMEGSTPSLGQRSPRAISSGAVPAAPAAEPARHIVDPAAFSLAARLAGRGSQVLNSYGQSSRIQFQSGLSSRTTSVLAVVLLASLAAYGRSSFLSRRRPGESEVAAAVGR